MHLVHHAGLSYTFDAIDRGDVTTSEITDLFAKLEVMFAARVKVNFEIQYHETSIRQLLLATRWLRSAGTGTAAIGAYSLSPLLDLLGRIFYNARALHISRMYRGMSSAVVLEIRPTLPSGIAMPVVVKLGRRDKIETEDENYREFVEPNMQSGKVAQRKASAYTVHLGAIEYTLGAAEVPDTVSFEEYFKRPAKEIISALENLFQDTFRLWNLNRDSVAEADVRELYLKAFELQARSTRIPEAIALIAPELDQHATT